MPDRLVPAVSAAVGAVVMALVLLVPFVAFEYRRRGALGARRALAGFAVLLYALAVVAYVVLPLPTLTAELCSRGGAGTQLRPGQFLADVVREGAGSPGQLLRNPAVAQVVFNAALFVPLGVLVRGFLRRGVLVTVGIGLGVSLLAEATQLTGVWSAYPCSYRLFDVDDLLVNTAGALAGALLATALPSGPAGQGLDPGAPRPVTAQRRLLGMACDWVLGLGLGLAGVFVVVVVAPGSSAEAQLAAGGPARAVLTGLVPALAVLVPLVLAHRTVGEALVRLRPREPVRVPSVLVRWLLGIGGYLLLASADAGALAAAVGVVAVLVTAGHRGLAYRVVGWELQDDREDPSPPPRVAHRAAAEPRGASR